jgi:TetR/AcrR family transcriptional repressor of uid operon
MGEICAEAAMSPGALYRYFPSKEAIIAAIAEAERERHAAFFARLAEADDPVEALASIGVAALERVLAEDGRALLAETIAEATRNPAVRAIFERNATDARDAITTALRRGQAAGLVDPDLDVATACRMVMALGDGLCAHQAFGPRLDLERMRPVLRILLLRFFRPPAGDDA